jgi:hypothetical protein
MKGRFLTRKSAFLHNGYLAHRVCLVFPVPELTRAGRTGGNQQADRIITLTLW